MADPSLSQVRLVRGVVCRRLVLPAARPPLATPMVHCLLRGEAGATRVETQTHRHALPARAWALVPRGQACALHGAQAVAWAVWFAPAEVPTGGIDGDLVETLVHRAFLGAAPLTVTPATDAAAQTLLRTMAEETGAGRPGALDCCRGLLQHLLVLLARDARLRAETRQTRPLAAGRERLEAALALVEARFAEPLTVADLAAAAGLRPSQFHACFRRVVGSTPLTHLTRHRRLAAQRLLLDSDLPIVEVALRCGFASLSRMYAIFAHDLRTSPGRLRAGMLAAVARAARALDQPGADPAEVARRCGFADREAMERMLALRGGAG